MRQYCVEMSLLRREPEAVRGCGGIDYAVCPECATFMVRSCGQEEWAGLLQEVGKYKRTHHSSITASRNENVYLPKLEWIENTLRLHGVSRARLVEFATPPSAFLPLLRASGSFEAVLSIPEYVPGRPAGAGEPVDAAVLLESLDRSADPAALLTNVAASLKPGGLLFVTALVSTGFDISVLGLKNLYVYPPDRANCFSVAGLVNLLKRAGLVPVEISTPGVLDVEIVGVLTPLTTLRFRCLLSNARYSSRNRRRERRFRLFFRRT